jgi:hypothetical protein
MNKKLLLYLLLAVTLFLLFRGLGDEILYAKSGIKKWIPFLIIFLLVPTILSKLLKLYHIHGKANLAYSLGPIILIGPLFGFWIGHLSDVELANNGVKTIGIVSEKWWSKPAKRKGEWLLKCEFLVNGNRFKTFSMEDEDNLYQIGDTLTILYSPKHPDNNTIMELD